MEGNKTTKDNDVFGGFTEAFDYLKGNFGGDKEGGSTTVKVNNDRTGALEVDPEELEKLGNVDEIDEDIVEDEEVDSTEEEDEEDLIPSDDDDPDTVVEKLKTKKAKQAPVSKVKEDTAEEDEGEIVGTFFDLFSNELGWEVDDETKPKNIKDLISTMAGIIEENSKPDYANEDLKRMDEYVRKGGSLENFFKETAGDIDVNKLDLDRETDQKRVLREYLKTLNLSEDKIEKRIARYEEALVLEDEAKEAAEALIEYKEKKAQKLLKEQEDARRRQIQEQQSFVDNVKKTIEQLDDIQGVQITSKQKKELFDYLFKVDADGRTPYQKDYSSNILNLITSAFVVKEGKNMSKKVQASATTNAVKELQKKLKSKNLKNQKSYEGNSTLDTLSLISKTLARN